jgi:hypothetical protein
MKFSPSTGNFYPDDIAYAALPDDLIDVSGEGYTKAMSRAADEAFSVDADGAVTITKIGPTDEQIKASVKAQARKLLAATDYTQSADVAADLKNVAAFTEYRSAVRAIFRDPPVEPDWPDVPTPDWA